MSSQSMLAKLRQEKQILLSVVAGLSTDRDRLTDANLRLRGALISAGVAPGLVDAIEQGS